MKDVAKVFWSPRHYRGPWINQLQHLSIGYIISWLAGL
jgi:hypothetical protein